MTSSALRLFTEYAECHKHPTNRLTHKVAIPLIVFHIVAMLDWVRLFTLPGGWTVTLAQPIFLAAAAVWIGWDLKAGTVVTLVSLLAFPLGALTPKAVVVGIAVVGWLVQLAGHLVWEKKQPAFFRNLLQALVGPLFFVAVLIGEWPLRAKAGAGPT
jgi:uncharacterized membrane protein YGL010W